MQEPSVGAAREQAQTAYCVVSAIRCMNGIGHITAPRKDHDGAAAALDGDNQPRVFQLPMSTRDMTYLNVCW